MPNIGRAARRRVLIGVLAWLLAAPLAAQEQSAAGGSSSPAAASTPLLLQLNKLEPINGGACRASFVLRNEGEAQYDSLKLDLVSFRPDGVIGQRLLVELAPVAPEKTLVKAFDFEGVGCGEIERILVNEVSACRTSDGEVDPDACLDRLRLETLAAELWK